MGVYLKAGENYEGYSNSFSRSKIKSINDSLLDLSFEKCFEKRAYVETFRQGNTCVFYVKKGLLKVFSTDENGVERIITFLAESSYFELNIAAVLNTPNQYAIQALENSTLCFVDLKYVKEQMLLEPLYMDFMLQTFAKQHLLAEERINILLKSNAIDRFTHFKNLYTNIIHRLKATDISSFLGITSENFSRLKSQLLYKT